MQKLTAMTLGAILIGLAGFVYDTASGQQPTACPQREVALYFEKGATEFNDMSKQLVQRVALEAKACGAKQVVAETKGGERAAAISQAFEPFGVRVILVSPRLSTSGDGISDRTATVRLGPTRQAVG